MREGNSIPINKIAAIVTQPQPKSCEFKIKNRHKKINVLFWKNPKKTTNHPRGKDLTGVKFGRLTVIGYLGKGKWQCKCSCGNYNSRKQKAILNKNNNVDACEECREIAYIKRTYDYLKTGKNCDVENYY